MLIVGEPNFEMSTFVFAGYTYLIEGANGSTYIGATTNVMRRVCEHNGEVGYRGRGAQRTQRHRPWRVIAYVDVGSYANAHEFEWSWQHPEASYYLRSMDKLEARPAFQNRRVPDQLRILDLLLVGWRNRNNIAIVHYNV